MQTLDKVASVYSGAWGKCCCGCSGKHTYSSALRDNASKTRGYTVDDDEVNDRTVKMIYNKVISLGHKHDNKLDGTVDESYMFARSANGNRIYIVYFDQEN